MYAPNSAVSFVPVARRGTSADPPPEEPISRHLADAWLRKAEALAEVEPQKDSLWEAFWRKWSTERKHLSAADVAAAGGWGSVETLQWAYQQADQATMLRVVLDAGELREAR